MPCIEDLPAVNALQLLQAVSRKRCEMVVRPADGSGQFQFHQALACAQGLQDLRRLPGEEFRACHRCQWTRASSLLGLACRDNPGCVFRVLFRFRRVSPILLQPG